MQEKSRRTCNDVFEMPAMLPTTFALVNNPAGAVTGYNTDASNVGHGFLLSDQVPEE
jgi:hypothetical protein